MIEEIPKDQLDEWKVIKRLSRIEDNPPWMVFVVPPVIQEIIINGLATDIFFDVDELQTKHISYLEKIIKWVVE